MVCPLLNSSLDTYRLCISSLECKAFCVVIIFLVFCSINLKFLFLGISKVSFLEIFQGNYQMDLMDLSNYRMDLMDLHRSLSFEEISATKHPFKKFSRFFSGTFSYFFLRLNIFDGVHFQYSQVLIIFLFFEHSNTFLTW